MRFVERERGENATQQKKILKSQFSELSSSRGVLKTFRRCNRTPEVEKTDCFRNNKEVTLVLPPGVLAVCVDLIITSICAC